MQTKIKRLPVTEYYKIYHNYDLEEAPSEVKAIVENDYRKSAPWEVEVIKGTIEMVSEFHRYNKERKRKISAMAYFQKFFPLYWKEAYPEL